jgi:hypothetical protein
VYTPQIQHASAPIVAKSDARNTKVQEVPAEAVEIGLGLEVGKDGLQRSVTGGI